MGALQSVTPFLPVIQKGADVIFGGASHEASYRDRQKQQKQALQQLKARQRLSEKQAAEDAALKKDRMQVDAVAAEKDRQRALRRAVARQRANLSARGISANDGGSSEAILLGLFDETDEERAQREKLDNLRNRALDQGLSQKRSLNVLQRTQLQQKQKIGRLSSNLERGKNLFDSGVDALETGLDVYGLLS